MVEKLEYKEGFPEERGLYKCKVDGKEQILVHHVCLNSGKHWWSDVIGYDVVGFQIQFQDKKLSAEDIKPIE